MDFLIQFKEKQTRADGFKIRGNPTRKRGMSEGGLGSQGAAELHQISRADPGGVFKQGRGRLKADPLRVEPGARPSTGSPGTPGPVSIKEPHTTGEPAAHNALHFARSLR